MRKAWLCLLYYTERCDNYSEDAVTEGNKIFEKNIGIFKVEVLHVFVWLLSNAL